MSGIFYLKTNQKCHIRTIGKLNMSDILKKLQPIFQDIFEDDELLITAESNAATVEDWDSLAHITLIFAIEQEFEIKFALGELEAMKNVGDMVELMQTKLSE